MSETEPMWTDEPKCPVCGEELHLWNDSFGEAIDVKGWCERCHKGFGLDQQFLVLDE
jgi:C4-type Zn-finger protein